MAIITKAPAMLVAGEQTQELTYEAYMVEPMVRGRYDIIQGQRVFQPELSWSRQQIIGNLLSCLFPFEQASDGHVVQSAFDVLIRHAPLQIRQPDLLFISHDRLMQGGGPPKIGPLEIGPELLAEIVMDNEGEIVLPDKLADYIRISVDECWVVRPADRTVEVLALKPNGAQSMAVYGAGEEVQSAVFSGLTVLVADVFAP